jgi:hypothetical protein
MFLWSMLVVCLLSLSQLGCSDDNTAGSNGQVTEDGSLDATSDAQPDAEFDGNSGGCTIGSTEKAGCDLCVCRDTGWECVPQFCPDADDDADWAFDAGDTDSTNDAESTDTSDPGETNDGGDTSADAGCTPGDTKDVDCNTCTCMNDATWACTKMNCTYDPCAGKVCGDNCTLCPPDDLNCAETDVVKTCGTDGTCSAGPARC